MRWRWVGLGLLAALLVLGVLAAPRVAGMVGIGAGYVAKQMCSCIHVAERELADCQLDMPATMDAILAEPLPDRAGMRAWALGGLVERTALYAPGAGCSLR